MAYKNNNNVKVSVFYNITNMKFKPSIFEIIIAIFKWT